MALTRTNEEVAEDAQQRQILAQQQMQAASQEAATLRQLADIQPLAPQQPTRLPIDWQHGADRAAARAANLEQMQLQHQQRLAEIAAREQADRESLAYKMQMQAKYAPKRTGGGGGAGYLSKLQKDYLDTLTMQPTDPDQVGRLQAKLGALEGAIERSGRAGKQFLDDVRTRRPEFYSVSPAGTKAGIAERASTGKREGQEGEAQERQRRRDLENQSRARRSILTQQAQYGADLMKMKTMFPEEYAKAMSARRELDSMAGGANPPAAAPTAPAAPARTAFPQSATAPAGNKPSPDAQWSDKAGMWFRKSGGKFQTWNGTSWSDVGG
jgi:hypothetical protein